MEKFFAFFRVFDLGFFVPGTILFISLLEAKWLKRPESFGATDSIATGLSIAWGILSVFVLGLAIHATSRLTRSLWRFLQPEILAPPLSSASNVREDFASAPRPSVATTFDRAGRQDLASYYWYMRATCFNLTTGLLLSIVCFWHAGVVRLQGSLLLILAALLFFWLGLDFDRALQKTIRGLRELRDEKVAP